jgi:hypothetical protein
MDVPQIIHSENENQEMQNKHDVTCMVSFACEVRATCLFALCPARTKSKRERKTSYSYAVKNESQGILHTFTGLLKAELGLIWPTRTLHIYFTIIVNFMHATKAN